MAGNNSNTSSNSTTSILGDADKRILQEIDTQLKEIEAIIYYQQVKDERDQYKELLDQKLEDLGRVSATIQRLEGELRDREELKRKLKAAEEDLEKSQKRVGELESLRVIISPNEVISSNGGSVAAGVQPKTTKMLLEMEKIFLKSQEDEVERRAKERLDSMKAEWEKTEKPRLVLEATTQSLIQIIDDIIRNGVSSGTNRSVRSELHAKVSSILDNEVRRRLNSEFERRVEAESQRRAQEKLNQLQIEQWPGYYKQIILPKVAELEKKIDSNVFSYLRGPWAISCQICGATHLSVQFYAEVVASIVKDGEIELECNGSYVRPVIGLGNKLNPLAGPQRFKLTLAELIDMQLRQ